MKMPKTNIKAKSGKVYEYDYKYRPIWVSPELHQTIKNVALNNNMTMTKFLEKLVKDK
jgi:uncharacterized hydantoinase/oxoprolinase family protein